jgi:hypothetical protein
VKHEISKPAIGKSFNQDCVGSSKSGIWILDGISEVKSLKLKNNENAVVWFVNQISEYLQENLDQFDLTIAEIVTNVVKEIREEFESLISVDIDSLRHYEQPSASIIIARNIQRNELELFSLGDCVASLHASNQVKIIRNYELKEVEEQFQKNILIEKKGYPHMTHTDFLNEIKIFERLERLRNDLTQNNQYHILNLNPDMIDKGQESIFHSIDTVILMSDGFSRTIDTYHLFKDYYDLLVNLEKQGVEQIYETMREIEQRDQNVQLFPRLRVSDDASLILASIK